MAKAKVVWRKRALTDIGRLYDFLYEKDQATASKAARVVQRAGLLLEVSPKLGRPMPDGTRRRELFMPFGSGFYVLRYFLTEDHAVVIIRVWHSRENRA